MIVLIWLGMGGEEVGTIYDMMDSEGERFDEV